MADWKKVAKAALLSDGRIDTAETEIIRAQIFEDDDINKSELEFVADIRRSATGFVKVFDELFVDAVKAHMLSDGDIDDKEAAWLRKNIFADGDVDDSEKRLLKELKEGAKSTGAGFDALYKECIG